jgi:ubiquinone/menaquinone biosynthesis C-methylase UbiE
MKRALSAALREVSSSAGETQAMKTPEEKAREVFGERAAFYTTSTAHTDPQVLARVVEIANPQKHWNVLDIATGSGHTAFALAPYVTSIIGIDITPEMLQEAETLKRERSIRNVTFQTGDVHHLPFHDGSFNLVTCRRAAHHFSNIAGALKEIHRVLTSGGRFVVDDRSVPEDEFADRCMNQLDTYHDESHVREYRPSEWRNMLQDAGFQIEVVEPYTRHRPLSSLTRGVSAENVSKIKDTLDRMTPEQRAIFSLVQKEDELYLNHWFVLVAAVRS